MNSHEKITTIRNQKITKYLKLPFQFDKKRLMADLESIIENQWIPHFNKGGYEGEWTSIALFAKDGDETNIFALSSDDSEIIETPIIKNCFYFKEVINHFKCSLLSVRLLRLGAGASIKPHSDYQLGYEDNSFRLHIPLSTNSDVNFVLDGDRLKMLPGECWYTNVNYTHSVSNEGKSDRIHLVIDGLRNAWSDKIFFLLAPKESFFPIKDENYSPETLKRIIEELKHSDQPAAEKLIIKLQEELNAQK